MPSTSFIEGVGAIDEVKGYRGEKILELASRLAGFKIPEDFTAELAVDVFYTFYLPLPSLNAEAAASSKKEQDVMRANVVSSMISSVNIWRVKPFTVADSAASIVASASFLEKLARILSQMRGPTGGMSERELGSRSNDYGGGSSLEGVDKERLSEAVEKAMEQAERDARTAKNIKQVVAKMGVGKASTLGFDESLDEILRLARETDVSKILDNVEGIKLASMKSRKTERFIRGWIEGLEYGDDLERLHYSQIVLPEEYFLYSLANSKLLLYRKVLPSRRGPIYLLLDKSGSMVGAKIDWGRAVAVALFKRSVEEGRKFYGRFFDSIAYPPIALSPNSRAGDIVRLLSYLARVRAGGGTDITRAIAAATEDIINEGLGPERRVSDIVLITDGEDRLSPELIERILKRAEARLHTVVIQGHNPYLQKASFRYMSVKKLEAREALKVIDFE